MRVLDPGFKGAVNIVNIDRANYNEYFGSLEQHILNYLIHVLYELSPLLYLMLMFIYTERFPSYQAVLPPPPWTRLAA